MNKYQVGQVVRTKGGAIGVITAYEKGTYTLNNGARVKSAGIASCFDEDASNGKKELESLIGEGTRTIAANWDVYLKSGCIVDLHVGRWRATTMLSLKDLGVDFEDKEAATAAHELLKPGARLLLPPRIQKKLVSIEATMRRTLMGPVIAGHIYNTSRTFAIRTRWGAFVPATSFKLWKERYEYFRKQFFELRDEIDSEYDSLIAYLERSYVAIAADVYNRLSRQGVAANWDEMKAATLMWVQNVVPSRKAINRSFVFSYDLGYIPTLTEELSETAALGQFNRERAQAIRQMQQEILVQQKAAKEKTIQEFEYAVRTQLYGLAYSVIASLIDASEKSAKAGAEKAGKILRGKVAFIRGEVEKLDVFQDTELAKQLKRLDSISDGATPDELAEAARELEVYLKLQLESLSVGVKRPQKGVMDIEIPDAPTRAKREIAMVEV